MAAEPLTQEPEVEARAIFLEHFVRNDSVRESTVYSLSFAGDSLESDFESDDAFSLIDDRMRNQLRMSYNALLSPSNDDAQTLLGQAEWLSPAKNIKRKLPPLERYDDEFRSESCARPLPKSVGDVISAKLEPDSRAIVITETKDPYRIITVNTAWEQLCGYRREECQGLPVGRLLQCPKRDMSPVTAMMGKLLRGEQAGATLTNYTKHGRKFQNNVEVGPIYDEMGKTVSFVGVLREVKDVKGNFKNFGRDRKREKLPFIS